MWNLENMSVTGLYMGEIAVSGVVELSRVAYGGEVVHTVVLDTPVVVYGAIRDRVILEHKYVSFVSDEKSAVAKYEADTADIGLPGCAVHQGDAIQQKCRGKPAEDEILEPRFLTGCSPSIAGREHIQRQTQYLDTQK